MVVGRDTFHFYGMIPVGPLLAERSTKVILPGFETQAVVARNPKQECQWPHGRTNVLQKQFKSSDKGNKMVRSPCDIAIIVYLF